MSFTEPFRYMQGEYVPDTVLLKTFSYLRANEKLICSQVCKKWHRLLMNGRPWTEVSRVCFREKLQPSAVVNFLRLCPDVWVVVFDQLIVTESTCRAVNKLVDDSPRLLGIIFLQCQLRNLQNLEFRRRLQFISAVRCFDEKNESKFVTFAESLYASYFQSLPVKSVIFRSENKIQKHYVTLG